MGEARDAHLAVSQALADWLAREYGVKAAVVYDRPARSFARPSAARPQRRCGSRLANDTQLGVARPPLVVCPTSWTPDEDFDLLLEALERAERQLTREAVAASPAGLPRDLAVFLTGRGPLRERSSSARRGATSRRSRSRRCGSSRPIIRRSSAWPISVSACISPRPASICR